MADAEQIYREVMTKEPPAPWTPFEFATRDFVFGQVWQRPGLTRRERRIITLAACAADDSPTPLRTRVAAAVHSSDSTKKEMDEIVLQFSAYYGFPKGEALSDAADAAFAQMPSIDLGEWRRTAAATPWEVPPVMPVHIWEPSK
jgi:4-carboxymuconolactone decarboxylase